LYNISFSIHGPYYGLVLRSLNIDSSWHCRIPYPREVVKWTLLWGALTWIILEGMCLNAFLLLIICCILHKDCHIKCFSRAVANDCWYLLLVYFAQFHTNNVSCSQCSGQGRQEVVDCSISRWPWWSGFHLEGIYCTLNLVDPLEKMQALCHLMLLQEVNKSTCYS
jgi:hypothetical protein